MSYVTGVEHRLGGLWGMEPTTGEPYPVALGAPKPAGPFIWGPEELSSRGLEDAGLDKILEEMRLACMMWAGNQSKLYQLGEVTIRDDLYIIPLVVYERREIPDLQA